MGRLRRLQSRFLFYVLVRIKRSGETIGLLRHASVAVAFGTLSNLSTGFGFLGESYLSNTFGGKFFSCALTLSSAPGLRAICQFLGSFMQLFFCERE